MPQVVITRAAAACARYAAALAPHVIVGLPVTSTEPSGDPEALARAIQHTGATGVACASARAAQAIVATHRAGSAIPSVFAVGPATLRVLVDAGVDAVHPDGVTDGASLARALVASGARTVIVVRAEAGRDDGIQILRAAGVEVHEVIAYRTVATAPADPSLAAGLAALAGGAIACALFAPSQVTALAALVDLPALRVPLVASGDTTAAAIREAGAIVAATADSPTPEGLARAVAAVYPAAR